MNNETDTTKAIIITEMDTTTKKIIQPIVNFAELGMKAYYENLLLEIETKYLMFKRKYEKLKYKLENKLD